MRRDKAVLDDKGVLRRGLVVRACASKFTLSSRPRRKPAGPHFQRTGAGRVRDCGVSPGSSRSTRPPPGGHSTVWTRRRRGRAWPLSGLARMLGRSPRSDRL